MLKHAAFVFEQLFTSLPLNKERKLALEQSESIRPIRLNNVGSNQMPRALRPLTAELISLFPKPKPMLSFYSFTMEHITWQ
jgi:hypothetical protein